MPARTISRKPRPARSLTDAATSPGATLRLRPRTPGMTQKAQRLSQPSWILR